MKKQLLLIIILGLIIGFVIFRGIFFTNRTGEKTVIPTTTIQSDITVEQKVTAGKNASFRKINISRGATALDLLKQTNTVKVQGEGKNSFVTEIDGQTADQKKNEFWSFYINGKPAAVGAGSYQLKESDQIEWKIDQF